jgi:hypothetical protein
VKVAVRLYYVHDLDLNTVMLNRKKGSGERGIRVSPKFHKLCSVANKVLSKCLEHAVDMSMQYTHSFSIGLVPCHCMV